MNLSDILGSSQDQSNGGQQLLAPQGKENVYRWATVVSLSPISILFDGDTAVLATTPDSLVGTLDVGDRVWCQLFGRRVIILGRGRVTSRDYPPAYGTAFSGAVLLNSATWTRMAAYVVVPGQNRLDRLALDSDGFTVADSGLYAVSISAQFSTSAVGRRYTGITFGSVSDGTSPLFGYQVGVGAAPSGAPVIPSWSGDVALEAGQRVMGWCYQDSGSAINVNQTMLKVRRVGPPPTS